MTEPVPIPHVMWGGPDELFVLKDEGAHREIHLRIDSKGDLILSTNEVVYVFNGRRVDSVFAAILDHRSNSVDSGQESS